MPRKFLADHFRHARARENARKGMPQGVEVRPEATIIFDLDAAGREIGREGFNARDATPQDFARYTVQLCPRILEQSHKRRD